MHACNSFHLLALALMLGLALVANVSAADQVQTANGLVEGTTDNGVHIFKGIPFAQPPVGDLRWQPPQPPKDWEGVRKADAFGPRPMQLSLFGDMRFRSPQISEDCLYLNVWTPFTPSTPSASATPRLPVLVYFYGGGFVAGDASEFRYDSASMARKGIVAVTVNYRLGVFGFLAHPELTSESPHHASGNYGLLDQAQALRWVQRNIAAFGGDPAKVTIAGESAGSLSVCALMASPLSKDLFAAAIGESGSLFGTLTPVSLAQAQEAGVRFATAVGAKSLADLRKIAAEDLLKAKPGSGMGRFPIAIDGYFFPESPLAIFAAGRQAPVPLLVGWNSREGGPEAILGHQPPTRDNYTKALQKLYGNRAADALKVYPAATDDQVLPAATALAGDRFIGYSTWKWSDLHIQTGCHPVYRYFYTHPRPGASGGAVHSAEIEYALGNLATNKDHAWTPDDYKVSAQMQDYFANFIKTADPNAAGLPPWPAITAGSSVQVMQLDVNPQAAPETHRDRYLFLDDLSNK